MAHQKVDRDFSGITDAEMLSGVQTMHDLFVVDVADFTAFDAGLDVAFAADLQTKITDALALKDDEQWGDDIAVITQQVREKEDECRDHFQDLKYFVIEAFPDDIAMKNKLGFDDYDDASRSTEMLAKFMKQVLLAATAQSVALIAKGYTQLKIDAFGTLSDELWTVEHDQEQLKKDRLVATQDRIFALNDIWTIARRISRASKRIYKDNPAKYHQYLLPGGAGNEEPVDLSASGDFTDSVTQQRVQGVDVQLVPDNLSVNTDVQGSFAFGLVPTGPKTINANHPQYEPFTHNFEYEGTPLEFHFELVPVAVPPP